MPQRQPVTADDVESAVGMVLDTLRPLSDRDWSVPAGDLEWSCAHTAGHLGHCLVAYAGQLAVRPPDRYVNFGAFPDDRKAPVDVLELLTAGGRFLAAMVSTSTDDVRAFHPFGVADAEGFAGMGCVETLVHGHDLAAGFGVPFTPPPELCARVVARMFPDLDAGATDPWTALRYATGRATPPGRAPVTSWSWRGAPLD